MGKLINILPVSDLRQDAAKILKQLRDKKDPIIITQRGRAAAVMIGVDGVVVAGTNVIAVAGAVAVGIDGARIPAHAAARHHGCRSSRLVVELALEKIRLQDELLLQVMDSPVHTGMRMGVRHRQGGQEEEDGAHDHRGSDQGSRASSSHGGTPSRLGESASVRGLRERSRPAA